MSYCITRYCRKNSKWERLYLLLQWYGFFLCFEFFCLRGSLSCFLTSPTFVEPLVSICIARYCWKIQNLIYYCWHVYFDFRFWYLVVEEFLPCFFNSSNCISWFWSMSRPSHILCLDDVFKSCAQTFSWSHISVQGKGLVFNIDRVATGNCLPLQLTSNTPVTGICNTGNRDVFVRT